MSGTLRERPAKSGRWELRAYVGRDPETGKPRQVSRVFNGGKREAVKALDKLVHEVSDGQHVGVAATFGKLLDEWMEKVIRRRRARSTAETYALHIEKWIRPGLGDKRLSKLTAHDLDTYFGELEEKGLAGATIKLQHAIIRSALSQAEAWEWIKGNPAKRSKPDIGEQSEAPTVTPDQLRTLYFAAAAEDEDMAAAIALGALTGCRRGELCGLQWGDVDWEKASVRVERAWVPGSGGQHLTKTKTGKGRTVFIGAEGLRILRDYRAAKTGLLGHEPADDGWLLSMDGGDTPLRAKTLTEYVTALGRKTKIKVRLHSLRHFRATELIHAGVDLPTAAGQMGHTPAVMAETYLHTNDERGAAAGELVSAVIGKALEAAKGSTK
jgi:integrase